MTGDRRCPLFELLSSPRPDGLAASVRLAPDARLVARFAGETEDRDLTGWFADLVVLGAAQLRDLLGGLQSQPQDAVHAASLALVPPDAELHVDLFSLPERTQAEVSAAELMELLALAVGQVLTEGVAAEMTDETPVSDSPAPLFPPDAPSS